MWDDLWADTDWLGKICAIIVVAYILMVAAAMLGLPILVLWLLVG